MARKIKYAPGVEPAQKGPLSQDLAAALKEPAKIRITTMIDADVYDELKLLAKKSGHGKYQTVLNALLRATLLPENGQPRLIEAIDIADGLTQKVAQAMEAVKTLTEQNEYTQKQLKKMWDMLPAQPRRSSPKKKSSSR